MAKGPRYVFLDVLRGIAVLWMIQVHITNVLLDPALRALPSFDLLNLSNGFVAPTFIFAAGSGLWIALSRKGASYLQWDASLWGYILRLGYILFWAYMLHVPVFSLDSMMRLPAADIFPWLQFDVLHTIVFASLTALGIFLLVKDLKKATWIYGFTSLAIMYGTVFVPEPFRPFTISPFPYLPWATYLFAGAFITGKFMEAQDKRKFAVSMMLIGVSLPVLIFMLKAQPFTTPWTDVWWKTSPGMHLFRISGILLTFGALYLIDERLRLSKVGVFLQNVGTESLFLYISHLLVVYGEGGPLMKSLFGVQYTGYGGVAISWVLVSVPLILVMYQWKHIKQHRPDLARRMLAVQVGWMVVTLMVIPDSFSMQKLFALIR
jgi:uncharacterized membrane protein